MSFALMLSANDFAEKQILIVKNSQQTESKLRFQNDNLVFANEETENRVSCHKVLAVFVVGDTSISTVLLRKARQHGISFFLLNRNLESYAEILSSAEGNYLLRQKQYTFLSELSAAKKLVANKALNQLMLLRGAGKIADYDLGIFAKIENANTDKELLGLEGSVTKKFFQSYFKEIDWYRRLPRAKVDVNNLLLDIGYTMMLNYIDSLLHLFGFDVYKGFYHKLFFKRKSLSCDIVEPFRCIIDKQLLKSFNLKQIDLKDFTHRQGKYAVSYDKSTKYMRIFFEVIMDHKDDIYQYIYHFYRYMNGSEPEFPEFKLK